MRSLEPKAPSALSAFFYLHLTHAEDRPQTFFQKNHAEIILKHDRIYPLTGSQFPKKYSRFRQAPAPRRRSRTKLGTTLGSPPSRLLRNTTRMGSPYIPGDNACCIARLPPARKKRNNNSMNRSEALAITLGTEGLFTLRNPD